MAGIVIIRRMFRFATVLALSFAVTVVVATAADIAPAVAEPMPVGVPGTWALKFDEEFNSVGLNTSVWTKGWQHEGISGPMSGQCLSSVLVNQPSDGYLHFYVVPEHHACEWEGLHASQEFTGALVESNPGDGVPGHSGFSYQYGYVEWRTYVSGTEGGELPDWPGLWTVPAYQGSKHETEMDTMEGLYGKPCFHVLNFLVREEVGGCSNGGYAGRWHTYGMDWESGAVAFYYDGKWIGEEYNNTFKPQYLIMDLVPPAPYRNAPVGAEMSVDYVRVWQHPPPPQPPTAATGGATGVEANQATVSGTVNPDGSDTHYYWQYGASTGYDYQAPASPADAGSGTTAVPVSVQLSGLAAATTYHYRLVASSVGGISYGSDQTFTTLALPRPTAVLPGGSTPTQVYYPDASNNLTETAYSLGNSLWETWNVTAGGGEQIAGQPAVVEAGGEPWVYARDPNNHLVETTYSPTAKKWEGWNITSTTGISIASDPTVLEPGGSVPTQIYYRDTSNNLIETGWVEAAKKWESWNETAVTGVQIAGQPAVVEVGGEPWVYARDPNNNLVAMTYSPTAKKWEGWSITASTGSSIASDPAVVLSSGSIEVFAGNPGRHLMETTYNSGSKAWTASDLTTASGSELLLG